MVSAVGQGFLAGGGEMGELIRAQDWTTTPLGPPEAWPQSLKAIVRLVLSIHQPACIVWGQAAGCLYNDACGALLAPAHRQGALGRPGNEVWGENWSIIGPGIDSILSGHGATWHEHRPLTFTRFGATEASWWTYSLCPIEDDTAPGTIGGVLVLCQDVTEAHRARETIRENKARLRALFDSGLIGLGIIDTATGRMVEANDRALQLMGSTREEVETGARDWRGVMAIEDMELDEHAMRQGAETGQASALEKAFTRNDGSRAHVRISFAPLADQPGRVVIAIEDLTSRRAAEAALRRSQDHLQLAQEAGEVGTWEWDIGSGALHWSESCHKLHGTDPAHGASFAAWRDGIHPEDWPRVETAIRDAIDGCERAWRVEFRFRRVLDGAVRWLAGRGEVICDPGSKRALRILGVGIDITERREAEERLRLVARELDHRAKNALAVVLAALRLTPKDEPAAYARAVEGRVKALARAHSLLAQDRWTGADLRTVLEGELAPFLADHRTDLGGPRVMLPAIAAQPITMAVHELATNAVKHGALSVPGGRISISWRSAMEAGKTTVRLRWVETGGPPVHHAPQRQGFGSRVLDSTIRGQLGGNVSLKWERAGLVCELEVPLTRTPVFSTAAES